jgi:hypothetical protein
LKNKLLLFVCMATGLFIANARGQNTSSLPQDSIHGPDKVCLSGTGTYSLSVPGNAAWTLHGPGSGIVATGGPSNSFTTPPLTSSGAYVLDAVWTSGSLFCPPPSFLIKVLAPPPPADSIIGPNTACFGSPVTYTAAAALPGTTFAWSATTGTCNPATGDHTDVTFTGASPATLTVRRVSTDAPHCYSDPFTIQVYRPTVTLSLPTMDTVD